HRNRIIESLQEYDVPSKLIRLIPVTLRNTTARIKVNNQLSNKINVTSEVNQGDSLSSTLFSIVVDKIMKQRELRGNIPTKLKQYIAYVDDLLLTSKKPNISARPTGRPKNKWEDNVRNDLRNMKIQNCLQQTKDRMSWKKIVEKAKAF
ncbi:hypothetical protein C0J52_13953, partial [Blattella germanica]